MSQKYREGNFFSVPLGRDGFAIGLIARQPRRGSVLLGYFFGPRHPQADLTASAVTALKPQDAKLVCRFKDGGLHRGLWRVFAVSRDWQREAWPVPAFLRKEGLSGRGIRVEYDGENLMMPSRESEVAITDSQLPEDVLLDEARVTELLERLLHEQRPAIDPGQWTG